MTSDWPTMACWMSVRSFAKMSAARVRASASTCSMLGPCVRDEDVAARRLEQREGATQVVGRGRVGMTDRARQGARTEAGQPRQGGDALLWRQATVILDAAPGRFAERAHAGGVQRHAAAVVQRETAGAANLIRQRTTRGHGRR